MDGVCTVALPTTSAVISGRKYQRSNHRRTGGISFTPALVLRSCWLVERRWNSMQRRSPGRSGVSHRRRVQIRAAVADILYNQVIVSSALAAVLGQLVKPATSAVFGKGFNWKLILKPGGMPSTHSASVTAAATALGMERGLSDSVFGLAVILASLVMYDAQGVRRSVGKQAEVINAMVFAKMANYGLSSASVSRRSSPLPIGVELARDPVQAELSFMEDVEGSTSQSLNRTAVMENSTPVNGHPNLPAELGEEQSQNGACARTPGFLEGVVKLPSVEEGEVDLEEFGSKDPYRHIPLKESVGHTKLEVFVGAVWGIFVALALRATIR